jgi:hypothetical protein
MNEISTQPAKLRFYEQAGKTSQEFSEKLLSEHPELAGVCVVFLWDLPGTGLPSGTVLSRSENGIGPDTLSRVMTATHVMVFDLTSSVLESQQQAHQQQLNRGQTDGQEQVDGDRRRQSDQP